MVRFSLGLFKSMVRVSVPTVAKHTEAGRICVGRAFAKLPAIFPCAVAVFQWPDEISGSLCRPLKSVNDQVD